MHRDGPNATNPQPGPAQGSCQAHLGTGAPLVAAFLQLDFLLLKRETQSERQCAAMTLSAALCSCRIRLSKPVC